MMSDGFTARNENGALDFTKIKDPQLLQDFQSDIRHGGDQKQLLLFLQ